MGQLIDSSVFIGLERHGASSGSLDLPADGEPLGMASITLSELLVGVHRADSEHRRQRRRDFVESLLADVKVEPFDETLAGVHAELWASMAAKGELIGDHDLIIAATAIGRNYSVLTSNVREFGRVPGLVVTRPAW